MIINNANAGRREVYMVCSYVWFGEVLLSMMPTIFQSGILTYLPRNQMISPIIHENEIVIYFFEIRFVSKYSLNQYTALL